MSHFFKLFAIYFFERHTLSQLIQILSLKVNLHLSQPGNFRSPSFRGGNAWLQEKYFIKLLKITNILQTIYFAMYESINY